MHMIHHFCPQNPIGEHHGRPQMRIRVTMFTNLQIPQLLIRPKQLYRAPTIRPARPCAQKEGRHLRTVQIMFQVARLSLLRGLLLHRFLSTVLYQTQPFTRIVPTFQVQKHQLLKKTIPDSVPQQSIQTMLSLISRRGNFRRLRLPVHIRLAGLPPIQIPAYPCQKTLSRPTLPNHVPKP